MSGHRTKARRLALSIIAGRWDKDSLADRIWRALAGGPPDPTRLAARLVFHFDRGLPPSMQELTTFLQDEELLRQVWEGSDDEFGPSILLDPPVAPDDPGRWARERNLMARGALTDGHPETAYALIAGHGLTSGAVFADAEFLAGWIQLAFLGNPDHAFDHFQTLFNNVRFPISRARGAYWSARAAQAAGDAALASEWFERAATYPTTFYGQFITDGGADDSRANDNDVVIVVCHV